MTCVLSQALAEAKLKLKKSEESRQLTEKQLINKVTVAGAPNSEVNGTYTRTPECRNGAPAFAMHGLYSGNNTVFELFLAEEQNGSGGALEWRIAATQTSNSVRTVLYKGKWLMPESHGWNMALGFFCIQHRPSVFYRRTVRFFVSALHVYQRFSSE